MSVLSLHVESTTLMM